METTEIETSIELQSNFWIANAEVFFFQCVLDYDFEKVLNLGMHQSKYK